MPTTKPLRTRPGSAPARVAAHYKPPTPDHYANLTRDEQLRADLHRDVDTVIDALVHARSQHDAHGWPATVRREDGSPSTDREALRGPEVWATRHDDAGDWLAEQHEATRGLSRVARQARNAGWRTLDPGTEMGGVRVGGRAPEGACAGCGHGYADLGDGRLEESKRLGQETYHLYSLDGTHGACYWVAWRREKASAS